MEGAAARCLGAAHLAHVVYQCKYPEDGEIQAVILTENNVSDGAVFEVLLEQIE